METYQWIAIIVIALVLLYVAYKLHQLYDWVNHKGATDAGGRIITGEEIGLAQWIKINKFTDSAGGTGDELKPPEPPGGM